MPKTVKQLTAKGELVDYPEMPILSRLEPHSLRDRLMREVRFRQYDKHKQEWYNTAADLELCQMLLQRRGSGFRPLTGLGEAPIVRLNGELRDVPGYDPVTGLYLCFHARTFTGRINPTPTREEARESLKWLNEHVLDGFRFKSPLDRLLALGMLLTAMNRKVMDLAPAGTIKAAEQKSGKTTLAQIISRAAFGRPAAVSAYPRTEEEMGKRLVGWLSEGHSIILLDNLGDGSLVDSPELAKVLTSDVYNNRVLGTNDEPWLPTSVLWLITGNCLGLSRDMASRSMLATLDARDPNRGRIDPAEWALVHRGEIVRHALTITLAYLHEVAQRGGAPGQGDNGGLTGGLERSRFPQWDCLVRYPLWWLSDMDIGDNLRDNQEAAVITSDLDIATDGLFRVIGPGKAVPARDILALYKGWRHSVDEAELELANVLDRVRSDGESYGSAIASSQAMTGVLKKLDGRQVRADDGACYRSNCFKSYDAAIRDDSWRFEFRPDTGWDGRDALDL